MTSHNCSIDLSLFSLPAIAIIAVSGGRDSMVLAHLCAMAAKTGSTRFIAVTVDHGLRDGSDEEAKKVRDWCGALGLPHEIVTWSHDQVGDVTGQETGKPNKGIQAKARHARYSLLLEAAKRHNATAIITAHTKTDMAETVFMRLMRGSGVEGLGAMREESLIAVHAEPAIRLVRPCLGVMRDEVTAFAKEENIPFINDPSNDDPTYERIRVRALLYGLEEQKLMTTTALVRTAKKSQGERARKQVLCRRLFQDAGGVMTRWGGIILEHHRVEPQRDAIMLVRSLFAVGAGEHPPMEEEVIRLANRVKKAKQGGKVTLGGAIIEKQDKFLIIYREPAALYGRAGQSSNKIDMLNFTLKPGEKTLWDKRYIIENVFTDKNVMVKLRPANETQNPLFSPCPRGALAGFPMVRILDWLNAKDKKRSIYTNVYGMIANDPWQVNNIFQCLLEERFTGDVLRYPPLNLPMSPKVTKKS